MGAGSDDHSGFSEGWTFPGSGSPRQEKMNVLEAVSRLSGTDLLSLCVPAGTVISENWISTAAFPSALYAGGESGKRGTAGDVWTAGLERALLDAYAAHFLPGSGRKRREVSIMSRNISYREMRRSGKI